MAVPTPEGLTAAGAALWDAVASKYELRPDEAVVLLDAARTADMIATLESALEGEPLMVRGSQGQQVLHPLVSELRQQRAAKAALLRQIKLPDDGDVAAAAGALSARNRAAANARWAKRGA